MIRFHSFSSMPLLCILTCWTIFGPVFAMVLFGGNDIKRLRTLVAFAVICGPFGWAIGTLFCLVTTGAICGAKLCRILDKPSETDLEPLGRKKN